MAFTSLQEMSHDYRITSLEIRNPAGEKEVTAVPIMGKA